MATTLHEQPVIEFAGEKLKGRVAMVTGGTRGIGAAICRSLAGQGASVAAGYSHNRERAEQFQAELARSEVPVSLHQGNVGTPEDCRRTVHEVVEHHGRLDILVNNAGITSDKTVFKLTDEDWHKVIAVNLSGAFFMSKAALEHMVERGSGRIVNISSIIGQTGNVGQINYAASKSGMFGLTTSLAKEAAFALKNAGKRDPHGVGITVNTVTPGYVETEMTDAVPEKAMERVKSQIPLGRLGKPEEIANTYAWLASDEASYINGAVIEVSGGCTI